MSHNFFLQQNTGRLIKFDAHKTPEFKVKNNLDYVIYGTDKDWYNLQPDYYINLYNSSSKHNAIVNEKSSYTVGKGLVYDGGDFKNTLGAEQFLSNISEDKVLERSVKDRILQGGFCNEIIQNKSGDKVQPHHIDFSYIRVSKPEWDETEKRFKDPVYYYTADWSARKPERNPDFQEFYPFKFDQDFEFDKNKRYLFYYKDYRPNLDVYPLPEYHPCIPYIAADYEISNFTYNNVKNGFSAGYLVNFYNGEPSEDQKRAIVKDFDDVLHGTDNAGKSIKSFNEDKDSGVEITPINTNGQDDRFINLNSSIRDEIYTGHGVDPVIVGLKGNNGFNNNADEKRTAIEGWQNGYVDSSQAIFEEYFTSLLNYNDIQGSVSILRKSPIGKQFSEQTLLQIATTDQLLEMAGLPKSEIEKNIVSEALASLSPLVANKVLDSMSLNEIRSLINLDGTDSIERRKETTDIEMSKDDKLMRMFSESGVYDDEVDLLESKQHPIMGFSDAKEKAQIHRGKFINDSEINVLKMLISGADKNDIKKALDLTDTEYKGIVESLNDQGLLNEETPTNKGIKEAEKGEVFVVYKYVKRNDVSGSSITDTTRPFCRDLVRMSKSRSWTIEDIELMNNGMGLDVFTSRGGWRTLEGTNTHVPFCRHIWEQRLVRRK